MYTHQTCKKIYREQSRTNSYHYPLILLWMLMLSLIEFSNISQFSIVYFKIENVELYCKYIAIRLSDILINQTSPGCLNVYYKSSSRCLDGSVSDSCFHNQNCIQVGGCLTSAAMTHRDTMRKAVRLQKHRGRSLLEDHSVLLGRDRVCPVTFEVTPARMKGCTDGFPVFMLSFLH